MLEESRESAWQGQTYLSPFCSSWNSRNNILSHSLFLDYFQCFIGKCYNEREWHFNHVVYSQEKWKQEEVKVEEKFKNGKQC